MGINIDIVAASKGSSSSAHAYGFIEHIITDEEVKTFHINDDQLKDAVNKYFGARPDDAFLHSPTPWGDMYKMYDWPEIKMTLLPTNCEILSIDSQPIIVKTQDFVNNSSKEGTFEVGISDSVQETITSNWNTGGALSIGQSLEYKVGFLGNEISGTSSLSYTQSWGIGGEKSRSTTVGSSSGVTVTLSPGDALTASLSANRGTMKVKITYNAYLSGGTAVNYNYGYKGHHYWLLPISDVMSAGNISNSVISTETLEIGYYSDARIEIRDKKTSALRAIHSISDIPGIIKKTN